MIASKTYTGLEGTNYIQAPELAMTIVYEVKREGILHEKYISGSSNRTHVYSPSEARVYFPINFNTGGEKVFILYKETSAVITPVPVCVQVSIIGTLPNGVVGAPYSYSFSLGGTAPFAISAITSPAWATVSLSGSIVNVTGTPDTEISENIEFTITNCSAGTQTFNQDFEIIGIASAVTIYNNSVSGVFIDSIGLIPYTIQSGSFPISFGQNLAAVHPAYTGQISVTVSGIVFFHLLRLFVNSVLVQTLPVFNDGLYHFEPLTYLSSDIIEITLQ